MSKVLITGINGFAASHLARFLVNKGHEVHGTVRVRSDLYKLKDIESKITLHLIEMTDAISVRGLIEKIKPEQVYHLAAQSYVKSSWDTPLETYNINVLGTVNLLEAIKAVDKNIKVLVTSTSEVYGDTDGTINESTFPEPNTHYGISKYCQDMTARLYHKAFGMNVVITRSFNITGAGRADVFVDSNFAKQVVEIENGKEPVIRHGNLESARDFTDVHDVVKGYVMVMESNRWGEVFCLGQGKQTKISEVLNLLIKLSGKDIKTEIDPERFRPVDTKTMIGDFTKVHELGWKPEIPLEQSLTDLLNYWRDRLK